MKKIMTRIFAAFMVAVMVVFAPSAEKADAKTKTVELLDVKGDLNGTVTHSFTSKKVQKANLVFTVNRKADYTLRLEDKSTGEVLVGDADATKLLDAGQDGYYTGFTVDLKAHEYTLSILSDTSAKYSIYLYVEEKVMTISASKATITAGQKKTLKVSGASGTVKWKSSKKSVATVSSKGVVTAKKAGTTTITASTGSGKVTCKVTVKKNVYTDSKLKKSQVPYGLSVKVHKAYYKGGQLVCQLNLVNKETKQVINISKLTITVKNSSGKIIAKQTFKNVKSIPKRNGVKTITLKMSKKNVKKKKADLRRAQVSAYGGYTTRR